MGSKGGDPGGRDWYAAVPVRQPVAARGARVTVCVAGLWHLGTVTAACLASRGHDVVGYDHDPATIKGLANGRLPVFEPGLDDLVRSTIEQGRLRFVADPRQAVAAADVLWLAWDTPVDEDDRADVDAVLARIDALLPALRPGSLVIVSSQLPVG